MSIVQTDLRGYATAYLNVPQTWRALQTFPLGMISIQAADIITGFTPGSIIFAGAGGGLSQDAALTWDNTLKKLNLNLSGTPMAAAETDTGFQMDGADGFATTIFMDSHGATAAIDFRQQGGTKAAPTATAAGATMGQINFQGWDGTAYGKNARVRAVAEASGAAWTLTDHGVGIGIFTTAPGTTSVTDKFHVYGNGGATLGIALTNNGAGTLNLAALYSNNVLIVDSSGNITGAAITASGNLSLGAANSLAFTGRTVMQSGSDGNLTLLNNAGTGFTSLKFGGATASFPEIKRNGTAINLRLADDSADAPLTAGATTLGATTLGATTISAALTYGGVTLSNSVTGTLSMVLSQSPVLTGTPVLAAPSATTMIVGSSTTLPSPAVMVATANATTVPNPPTGTVLHVAGANGSGPQVMLDAFNSNATLTFRAALTSAAAPSALTTGSVIMNFGGQGYGATGYSASNRLRIAGFASENWSDTLQGTYITFITTPTGGTATAEAVRINPSGGFGVGTTTTDPGAGAILANTSIKSQGATQGIGYATGAGGAVTQLTSRTTGVTLDKVSGAITMFSAAGSATAATFTVTDSAVAATDTIHLAQKSGTNLYNFLVTAVAAGSFNITFFTTGGTSVDAPVINFVVIKAVAS